MVSFCEGSCENFWVSWAISRQVMEVLLDMFCAPLDCQTQGFVGRLAGQAQATAQLQLGPPARGAQTRTNTLDASLSSSTRPQPRGPLPGAQSTDDCSGREVEVCCNTPGKASAAAFKCMEQCPPSMCRNRAMEVKRGKLSKKKKKLSLHACRKGICFRLSGGPSATTKKTTSCARPQQHHS